jgi:site-specific recombinase XerD
MTVQAKASYSPFTLQLYTRLQRQYLQWCREQQRDPKDASTLLDYLAHRSAQGYSPTTLRQISAACQAWLYDEEAWKPDEQLSEFFATQQSRRRDTQPVQPFTLEMLQQVSWRSGLEGVRDRALMLVGFYGALHARELLELNIEDIEETNDGLVLHIRLGRTSRQVTIPRDGTLAPVDALEQWLEVLRKYGFTSGPVFRRIFWGRLRNQRTQVVTVNLIVKYYAEQLGYDPKRFTAGSLRAGFIKAALERGVPAEVIMQQAGISNFMSMQRLMERYKPSTTTRQLQAVSWSL